MRRLAILLLFAAAVPVEARDLAGTVDPFIGTLADFGQLTPAAGAPYGMVQLGPDTSPANHAGYDHAARTLTGFSHTRGLGVGCSGAGGDVRVSLGYAGTGPGWTSDKRREVASAGFYRVRYGDGITAAMTATRGAGVIRFVLPRAGRVALTVTYDRGYSRRHGSEWRAAPDGDLRAGFSAGTVCDKGMYRLYSATQVVRAGKPLAVRWTGAAGAALATLDVRPGDVIEVRTGLSSVDAAAAAGGARRNWARVRSMRSRRGRARTGTGSCRG